MSISGILFWPVAFEYQSYQSGDANRDGVFDQLDIVQVLAAGEYTTTQNLFGEGPIFDEVKRGYTTLSRTPRPGWGGGDWNGDGLFNNHDLIEALQHNTYGQPSQAAMVPEPDTFRLAWAGFWLLILVVFFSRGGISYLAGKELQDA
jgi:hypothetical protein